MIRGIVLYNLLNNGDLEGFYSNNHPNTQARILWERATLRPGSTNVARNFDCVYQDIDESEINCTLSLVVNNGIISAEWVLVGNSKPSFIGEGFQMNNNQIALTYWSL